MVRRLASLSGMGKLVGLLCMIPSTVKISLALVRQEEPVRWVTLPWGLPSSSLLAVTAHTAAPLATGLGLGLLAGLAVALVGLALVPTSQHRQFHRSYWDVSLLTFFLCFAPLWSRLWGVVRWLTGGAGSPVDLHGSLWPRGLPLAAAVGLVAAASVIHLLARSRGTDDQPVRVGRWAAATVMLSVALLSVGPLHGLLVRAGVPLVPLLVGLGLLVAVPLILFLLITVFRPAITGRFPAVLGVRVERARIPRRFQHAGLLLLWAAPAALLLCTAVAAIAGSSGGETGPRAEAPVRRPNLVLIYVDTLRRDHLSCYGRERWTTPSFDRLAAGSVQFRNATSPASHTVPAVCSVMTCRYPHSRGLARGEPFQLPGDSLTLAGLLRGAGYRTAAFIGNYILGRDYDTRIWQGFEVFDDRFPQRESERRIPEREAGALSRAAVSWIRAHRDQRFFLWLHFQDPHGPYTPPEGPANGSLLTEYGPQRVVPLAPDNFSPGGIPVYQCLGGEDDPCHYLAGYDGEISHTDRHVGLVLSWLRRLGLYEETVVVLLSDHGEAMEDDHGYYFCHGHDLTEDQVRVPLLLHVPGEGGGRVVSREVSTLDLFPTLLGLAGVEVPPGLPGRDLLSATDEPGTEEVVLTFTGGGIRAIRSGPWKLIQRGGRTFLYNTDLDPEETVDLSGEERERTLRMTRAMKNARAAAGRPGAGGTTAGWNDYVRRRLRSLGYLD